MPMTAEEKKKAIDALRAKVTAMKCETFDHWLLLFREGEELRKCSGYSKGAEDMIQKLVKHYEKELASMMKPFDRGDYD